MANRFQRVVIIRLLEEKIMLSIVEYDYETVLLMDEDGDLEEIAFDELGEYINEGWIEDVNDIEELI